jgi:transposase
MPRPADYQLDPDQLAVIQHAMEYDERPEVRIRAAAIHMLYKGLTQTEAGELLAVSRTTVFYWRVRWLEGGVEGLADQPRTGRPSKADNHYIEVLENTLEQDPHTLGYAFSVWTVGRLAQHMAGETGITLSVGRLRALLRRLGYVYRRPKRDLSHLQQADARETAQALLEELKRGRSRPVVSYSLWTKPA